MDVNGKDGICDFGSDIEALSEHESGIRLDAAALNDNFEDRTVLMVLIDIFQEMKDWRGVEVHLNLPNQFFIRLFTHKPHYRVAFYDALKSRIQECAIEVLPGVISELMGIFQEPDIDAKTRLQAATLMIGMATKNDGKKSEKEDDSDALSKLYKQVKSEQKVKK